MHLAGWTWEEMALQPSAVMEMNFPQIRPIPARYAALMPGGTLSFQNQEKQYRELLKQTSRFLEDGRRYEKAKAANMPGFRRDIKLEAMLPVIDGKQPLLYGRNGKERSKRRSPSPIKKR